MGFWGDRYKDLWTWWNPEFPNPTHWTKINWQTKKIKEGEGHRQTHDTGCRRMRKCSVAHVPSSLPLGNSQTTKTKASKWAARKSSKMLHWPLCTFYWHTCAKKYFHMSCVWRTCCKAHIGFPNVVLLLHVSTALEADIILSKNVRPNRSDDTALESHLSRFLFLWEFTFMENLT